MKNIPLFFLACIIFPIYTYSQILVGDTSNMHTRALSFTVQNGTFPIDLDCDGTDDIDFEVINSPQMRRNALHLLSPTQEFEVAVFSTGKVKDFHLQDTLQCLSPDLWTSFQFLVIGIEGSGGSFGNCCFDNAYVGFRKTGTDTLLGWIKISTALSPQPYIEIKEVGFEAICVASALDISPTLPFLYPNPVETLLILPQTKSPTLLYNSQGTQIQTFPPSPSATMEISVETLSSGIYFLRINEGYYKVIKK